jgi:peroxiredoxin
LGPRSFPAIILLVVSVGILCSLPGRVEAAAVGLRSGSRAPHVDIADLSGSSHALPEALTGKVAVIHFWSSLCCSSPGGGVGALRLLESLHRTFKAKGLVVAAVNVGQPSSTVGVFAERANTSYLILLDTDLNMTERYGCVTKMGLTIPQTFILDRFGIIRHKIVGEPTDKTLRKLIKGLI